MKLSEKQRKFIKNLEIDVDLENPSDSDMVIIEEKIANELEINGFDKNYNPNKIGTMCESILDVLND